jgi:hypothetical protein
MTGTEIQDAAQGFGVRIEVDGPMLERYIVSAAPVVIIQGPNGSGKSRASIYKLLLNALRQKPVPGEKVARRRTYIVRNTFDELQRTVMQDWLEIFPEDRWGKLRGQKPATHMIRQGNLEWEVTFLALDGEEDAKKLLSAQLSDVWFNELREIPRKLFTDAVGRTDRYPNAVGDCYRPQGIGDTNPAPEDHWISVMSGQCPPPEGLDEEGRRMLERPEPWEFLVQPPAMFEERDERGKVVGYRLNPERENARHTGARYYNNLTIGVSRAAIAEKVLNRPGLYLPGKPVWPEFQQELHVASRKLAPIDGHPIMVGLDFGRTPAAAIGQCVHGRWRILREMVAENTGAKEFARALKRVLATEYPERDVSLWGDPAGEDMGQSDDSTPFLMFAAEKLRVLPAPTNDFAKRRDAVRELFLGMIDGAPRIEISPTCVVLKGACAGGYGYKRLRIGGGADQYAVMPDKNRYSHVADALQYLAMGGGEGAALLGRVKPGAGRMTGQARPVTGARVRGVRR